jgi:hypothetical protein
MGGACSKYWGEETCIQDFGGGNLKESGHLEDSGVYGRVILRWIFENLDGVMDWIDLAQDMDR